MTVAKRKKKQKSARIVIVFLTSFCLVLLGVGVWLFLLETGIGSGSSDGIGKLFQVDGLDPVAQTGVMPGSSGRERLSGENLFGYRINSSPVFSADGRGKISIENPSFNNYLLVLELCLTDDPTLLYQSQYLAPNQYIESIRLSAPPSAGTYDAIAYLNLIDPKTMRLIDILETPITLTIKA